MEDIGDSASYEESRNVIVPNFVVIVCSVYHAKRMKNNVV